MHIACKHCKHTSPRCLIDPKDLWLDRQLHYLEILLFPKHQPSTLFQSTLYPAWPLVRWGKREVSFLLHHHMVPKIEGPCHIWVEGMLCLPLEVRMAKCRVDGRTPQACSLQEASPSSYLLRPLLLSLLLLLLLLYYNYYYFCSELAAPFVSTILWVGTLPGYLGT